MTAIEGSSLSQVMSVEDAEIFLLDHLWDGGFAWSADVKAAAAEHGIPPKQLWLAQEPRGFVPLEIIDGGFPRRTGWRLEPDWLAELKRSIAEEEDGERRPVGGSTRGLMCETPARSGLYQLLRTQVRFTSSWTVARSVGAG